MLIVLPFPRNIKTQIILPFQWLSVRLNNTRLNFSSAGSSSDSDSDSNPSKEKTSFKTDDAVKKKGFKGTNYIETSQIRYEKMIEQQMNFPSRKHQYNARYKKLKNTVEPSVLRELQNNQHKLKSIKNQFNMKRDTVEKPSVLRELQNNQHKLKSTKNQFNMKRDTVEKPSVLRELQNNQHKLKSTENQFNMKHDTVEELSVLRESQNNQHKLKSTENQFNMKHDTVEELSVLRESQNNQHKLKSVENEFDRKRDVSILRELKSNQHILKSDTQIAKETKQQKSEKPFITYTPIFNCKVSETNIAPELKTWKICEESELKRLMKRFPKNTFEEMIQWTEEGKLWQFPINNEQGMETEKTIHFSEHIFLEQHLEEWCPVKGPIRHFMELVCTGLSKNPYLTVEEKKAHIHWYKDYFGSKQDLLQKLGVVE